MVSCWSTSFSLRHVNDEIRLLDTRFYIKEDRQNGYYGTWIYGGDERDVVVVNSNGTLVETTYEGKKYYYDWKLKNGLIMMRQTGSSADFQYCGWVYDGEMHVWRSKYVLVIVS